MLMLPCLPVTIRPLINRGPAKKALHWDAEGEAADAYIMLCDSNSIYSLFLKEQLSSETPMQKPEEIKMLCALDAMFWFNSVHFFLVYCAMKHCCMVAAW